MSRLAAVVVVVVLSVLPASCGDSGYSYQPPDQHNDGWETASLAEVGLEPGPFADLVDHVSGNEARAVHGILVVRDDRLVFEEYFGGYRFDYDDPRFRGDPVEFDATTRHNMMSVTKAITGALVGIAIDQGHITSVDQPVLASFPEHHDVTSEAKNRITVEHLLNMTSGLEWNEWDVPLTDIDRNDLIQLFVVDDPIAYIAAKPVVHEPGTYWYYSGGDVNLLGQFLERATTESVEDFARAHLFEPLGISDSRWRYINPDVIYASGELELRPRDLAKFGSLYLNDGRWNGTQVLSSAWVDASLHEQVSIPGRAADGDGYSYQWFTATYEHAGHAVDAVIRTGWGGQALALFPDLDTLVVLTAGDYEQQSQVSELIASHVLPAIDQPG